MLSFILYYSCAWLVFVGANSYKRTFYVGNAIAGIVLYFFWIFLLPSLIFTKRGL